MLSIAAFVFTYYTTWALFLVSSFPAITKVMSSLLPSGTEIISHESVRNQADPQAIPRTHKSDPQLLPRTRMGRPTPRFPVAKWYCRNRTLLWESDVERSSTKERRGKEGLTHQDW
jgi:hypothetical protein